MSDISLPPDVADVPTVSLSETEAALLAEASKPEDQRIPLIDITENEDPGRGIDFLYHSGGDPNFEYSWLNTRTEMLEKNKMFYGYEIVKEGDPVKTLVPSNSLGERRILDVVLARISKSRAERLKAIQNRQAIERVRSANENWKQEAAAFGLKVEDTTRIFKKEGTF